MAGRKGKKERVHNRQKKSNQVNVYAGKKRKKQEGNEEVKKTIKK